MEIKHSKSENRTTLSLSGRFDFNVHREFKEAYMAVLNDSVALAIEIDLAAVDYLDSSALGMLLMLRERAQAALLLVLDSADELPVYQAERQLMGFDHAQVGAELAAQWKLPPMLGECIAYHHDIRGELRFPREVALVHIANILALMAEVHTSDIGDVAPIDPLAWEITGLDADEVIPATVTEAQQAIAEAEQLFLGK